MKSPLKQLVQQFGSLKISIVLFLLFATLCAVATFLESAYSTPTAWAMVYKSWYFELVQILLALNLICAIFRYKMFAKNKLPLLIFHLSFLLILIGAGLTRYLGFEGNLHIRENEAARSVVSAKSFVKFFTLENNAVYGASLDENIALLPFANDFKLDLNLGGEKATLAYKDLLLGVSESFVDDEQGSPLLVLMISTEAEGRRDIVLGEGESININGVNFAFLTDAPKPFVKIDENLQLISSESLNFMQMSDNKSGILKKNSRIDTQEKRLFTLGAMNFVVQFASKAGKIAYSGQNRPEDESFLAWIKSLFFGASKPLNLSENSTNALKFELSFKGQTREIVVFEYANPVPIDVAGQLFFVSYSPTSLDLPFEIYLRDFVIDRYPGSMSPSSYASEVRVMDGKNELDYRIFMNNVLDYKGYRFYQSSYDTDELGTILSVNKDPGKIPTYIGYFLLFAGMFLSLLNPKSRFRTLAKLVNQDALKAVFIGLCAVFLMQNLQADESVNLGVNLAQNSNLNENSSKNSANLKTENSNLNAENSALNSAEIQAENSNSSVNLNAENLNSSVNSSENSNSTNSSQTPKIPAFSPAHSKNLASLIVQKQSGRMVPLDTLAKEILEKVHKKPSYKGLEASGVLLSMYIFKQWWSYEPLIVMPKNSAVNEEIAGILGVSQSKFIRYVDFFDNEGRYILQKYVENANRKNPNARGVFDKEIIKLDERANIVNLVFSGDLLRFFPLQSGDNALWISADQLDTAFKQDKITQIEGEQVAFLFGNYINTAALGAAEGNFTLADDVLSLMKNYQRKFGAAVMPNESKIAAEIWSNDAQIFVKLTPIYLVAGLLLLLLVLYKMVRANANIAKAFKVLYFINILAFLAHSAGLILRAYLAEHAPWSNAYESMIYIAWALGLSGIFFSRKSPIALSLTAILAGLVLWVAHLGEMDPQITNLVPVLNSYWLSIHVSVITASYGFLGLSTLLGIFVLCLLCFMKKGRENIARNITEATRINEMAMILGLILLTIGNFLGAIWANESWGRYWSWDSKETWALISILVYAAVLHIRLVPQIANQWVFATASMFAYWVIIMTYFGVNYFLVGMHSYAAGDAAKVPNFVFVGFALMLILAIISYFKRGFAGRL